MGKKKKTTKKKARQVVNSKKVVIDGITFASSLEGTMYKLLKQSGIVFAYEMKTYTIFDSFKYEGECYERVQKRSKEMVDRPKVSGITYTPDFSDLNEEWIIEVKGRANESFPLRWKLFKQKMMERENPPMIFKPTKVADCKQVINILLENGYGKKKS